MASTSVGKYLGRIIWVRDDPHDANQRVIFYYDHEANINRNHFVPKTMTPQQIKDEIRKLLMKGPPHPAEGDIYE